MLSTIILVLLMIGVLLTSQVGGSGRADTSDQVEFYVRELNTIDKNVDKAVSRFNKLRYERLHIDSMTYVSVEEANKKIKQLKENKFKSVESISDLQEQLQKEIELLDKLKKAVLDLKE